MPSLTNGDFRLRSELPPEIAIEGERLSRRQKIADLLLRKSLEPIQAPQGKGRFATSISPWQGVGQLAEALAGGYLSYKNDEGMKELGDRYQKGQQQGYQDVVTALDKARQPTVTPGSWEGATTRMIEKTPPLQDTDLTLPEKSGRVQLDASMPSVIHSPEWRDYDEKKTLLRRALDANRMEQVPPDIMAQLQTDRDQALATARPMPLLESRQGVPDLYQSPRFRPENQPVQLPPGPAPTVTPATTEKQLEVIEALMVNPSLRYNQPAFQMLGLKHAQLTGQQTVAAQQAYQAKEHALTRELTREQKREDRDVRREGIEANVLMRMEQLRNTAALTQMQIDSREQSGRDAAELKKQLADQTAELKQMEIQSRFGQDKPKLKPGERLKADGTVEAIPGSDVYVKQSGLHSKDYGALMNMNTRTEQAMKKIDEILDPKNTGAFNSNFGGYNAYLTERIPGATQDTRQKIESVKSDLKTAGLEIIRSGGSIGSMTQAEWPIVEKMIDAIDPRMSEKAARAAFENIKTYLGTIRANATTTYDTEWGNTQFYKKTPPAGPPLSITGESDYDKLPSGTIFIGPDGVTRKKP